MQYVAYLDEKMPEKSDPLYYLSEKMLNNKNSTTQFRLIQKIIKVDDRLYIYDSRIVITIYERYYKLYYSFPFLTLHYFIAVYLIIPIVYLYW